MLHNASCACAAFSALLGGVMFFFVHRALTRWICVVQERTVLNICVGLLLVAYTGCGARSSACFVSRS